jgi:O-antigen/teichoic acid export membrane protein
VRLRHWLSHLVSGAFLAMMLGLLTSVVTARSLGPSGRGVVAGSMAWLPLLSAGLSGPLTAATAAILKQADEEETVEGSELGRDAVARIVTASVTVSAGLAVMVGALVLLISWLIPDGQVAKGVQLHSLAAAGLVAVPSLVAAAGRSGSGRLVVLMNVIVPAATAGSVVALEVAGKLTAPRCVMASVVSNLLAAVFAFLTLRRQGLLKRAHRTWGRDVRRLLVHMRYIVVSDWAGAVVYRADQAFLAIVAPSRVVGLYAVAVSVGNLGRVLGVAGRQITTVAWARRDAATARRFGWYTLLLGLGGAGVAMAALPKAVPFVFGGEFREAIPLAAFLIVGVAFLNMRDVVYGFLQGSGAARSTVRVDLWLALFVLALLLPAHTLGSGLGVAALSASIYIVGAIVAMNIMSASD